MVVPAVPAEDHQLWPPATQSALAGDRRDASNTFYATVQSANGKKLHYASDCSRIPSPCFHSKQPTRSAENAAMQQAGAVIVLQGTMKQAVEVTSNTTVRIENVIVSSSLHVHAAGAALNRAWRSSTTRRVKSSSLPMSRSCGGQVVVLQWLLSEPLKSKFAVDLERKET